MFVLIILQKIRERRLKVYQKSVKVLEIIADYQEARVKLRNTQKIRQEQF